MSVFPDIKKYGFRDIQFVSHIPGGFPILLRYFNNRGWEAANNELWLCNHYVRNKQKHVIFLAFQKSDSQCAQIIIRISTQDISRFRIQNIDKHKMENQDFIKIMSYILRKIPKAKKSHISYAFKRIFKESFFKNKSFEKYVLKGLKFRGGEKSPLDLIRIEETKSGEVLLEIFGKPTYSLSAKYLNSNFFKVPIKDMIELSDSLYNGFKRGAYGKQG